MGAYPNIMISVPTTAPLRMTIDIENCIDEYEKGGADIVITVTDAHRSPYFNMVKINGDGSVGLVCQPQSKINRRQDAPLVYDITTVCYAIRPEFVMSHNSIFEGRVKSVYVPAERAIDIDTLLDFNIAESLLNLRERKP
jgi:N-acylneuraminate cytidylyltransferase